MKKKLTIGFLLSAFILSSGLSIHAQNTGLLDENITDTGEEPILMHPGDQGMYPGLRGRMESEEAEYPTYQAGARARDMHGKHRKWGSEKQRWAQRGIGTDMGKWKHKAHLGKAYARGFAHGWKMGQQQRYHGQRYHG